MRPENMRPKADSYLFDDVSTKLEKRAEEMCPEACVRAKRCLMFDEGYSTAPIDQQIMQVLIQHGPQTVAMLFRIFPHVPKATVADTVFALTHGKPRPIASLLTPVCWPPIWLTPTSGVEKLLRRPNDIIVKEGGLDA